MEKGGWLYIMADRYRGGLYVGVSANLIARVHAHKEGRGSRHVADYEKTRLVYAERHEEIEPAIAREKLVKKWRREWKFALIGSGKPGLARPVGRVVRGRSVAKKAGPRVKHGATMMGIWYRVLASRTVR